MSLRGIAADATGVNVMAILRQQRRKVTPVEYRIHEVSVIPVVRMIEYRRG